MSAGASGAGIRNPRFILGPSVNDAINRSDTGVTVASILAYYPLGYGSGFDGNSYYNAVGATSMDDAVPGNNVFRDQWLFRGADDELWVSYELNFGVSLDSATVGGTTLTEGGTRLPLTTGDGIVEFRSQRPGGSPGSDVSSINVSFWGRSSGGVALRVDTQQLNVLVS